MSIQIMLTPMRGGGQFPLKTIEFSNTHGFSSTSDYYLYADDLVSAGIEFPSVETQVFVTAILKNSGSVVGTITAPYSIYYNNNGYNIVPLTNNSATLATGTALVQSTNRSSMISTNAANAKCEYSFSSIPTHDEETCVITYYLIEK